MQSAIKHTEALTEQLAAAKDAQRKLERLQRLSRNKDFKDLILEEYGVRECARLTHMSIHPGVSKEDRAGFLAMAQACGGVEMYIIAQERLLTSQISQIQNIEAALEDARIEEEQHDEGDED